MKLGAVSYLTDYSVDPAELARELEAHGYESLWAGDHSHIPISEKDRGRSDLAGPPLLEYKHLLDPIVALSIAAAATTTLKLASGMLLLAQRDPIQTAKSVASLDHVSGGRFLLGIAAGWNVKELRNHGTDPARRWRVMSQRLDAIKRIWRDEVAEYHGEHVDFTPLVAWPKPRPDMPVIIGCGPESLARVLRHGDEWAPLVDGWSHEKLVGHIAELSRLAADAGRGPVPVTIFPLVSPVEELELGSPLALTERDFHLYEEAGVDRLVVVIPPGRERFLPLLEHYATLRAP
jgi:probable F420-dependent oxidoreductase